ncbi:hypothetical protein IFM89_037828 [Coptis chinensis]|uniref:Uncharacterized protein n=1 Tax=Coptis chinensis TaxID=261450 RepID=A0A835LSZ3_9MAGN|nr:hypothetical protein IFM89_037828 [Coptis chinensis]
MGISSMPLAQGVSNQSTIYNPITNTKAISPLGLKPTTSQLNTIGFPFLVNVGHPTPTPKKKFLSPYPPRHSTLVDAADVLVFNAGHWDAMTHRTTAKMHRNGTWSEVGMCDSFTSPETKLPQPGHRAMEQPNYSRND